MFKRHRRLRGSQVMRDMVKDLYLDVKDFVYPLFIEEGTGIRQEIQSMPGQYRLSIDMLKPELDEIWDLGIRSILIFGIPLEKDPMGKEAYNDLGIVQEAVRFIKKSYPEMLVITDVCMCEYTSHGHCGILSGPHVLNDETLYYLSKIAVSHAKAGADMVAPSDMMDGRILAMRKALDNEGFINTPIMSYSVKYASSFYGPFRDAADSSPSFGDRKTYQMDFRSTKEALREAEADLDEGADILIVKPALSYLDVVKRLYRRYDVPIAVYNVSAEYSMVKAAAQNGWIDEKGIVMEKMYAFKRAGASIIITYHSKDIARWLKNKEIY
ncbi:porphobilinogen synthase [uncultured Ilyobacter sp.]|jgi:porphobilinogen synthase|uniref:porphobilinogen synthase n=1 Tax=uncultured Ilyobacter sp. TaxID=544433 RepID=UPI0029C00163|nr:porphobilinogen synthase [uncultured Ilyobacter sp.]